MTGRPVEQGYSLVSQQIRDLVTTGFLAVPGQIPALHNKDIPKLKIKKGFFVEPSLEARVQPGSFEPSLSDEVFILDAEGYGLLRPRRNESVYRILLQIPRRKRTKKSLMGGFEVKKGFTYLAKLNERFSPDNGRHITLVRSSPKSSTGRVFPKTRFLVDYNPAFDEVYRFTERDSDMWLLVQPIPFNLVLQPGLALNQLRFFSGDARLSDNELKIEFRKNPLLYEKKDGTEVPVALKEGVVSDGLRITLDAIGADTHGVFGLRARRNPDPIDLSKTKAYVAEDYFEPVIAGGRNSLKRGENYLVASNEVMYVPPHLSAELRRHAREGIEGRTHDAGFADPGFRGPIVLEVTPDEETEVTAEHGMPMSVLDFFRTNEFPDKVYGEEIGSNYQEQRGPGVSKHFIPFDYETAARNHEKLSRRVLVQDARILRGFRQLPEGFEPINEKKGKRLIQTLEQGFFHSRYDCEDDELVLQAIPYTIVFNNGNVFSYIRTEDKKEYGDKRLLGKHSIGLGGHATVEDAPNYIPNCLEREVTREEVRFLGERTAPILVGTLFATDRPVDRVHFGLIYTIRTNGRVIPNEKSIAYSQFVPIDEVTPDFRGAETETWSRILIPHLKTIYELSKGKTEK